MGAGEGENKSILILPIILVPKSFKKNHKILNPSLGPILGK